MKIEPRCWNLLFLEWLVCVVIFDNFYVAVVVGFEEEIVGSPLPTSAISRSLDSVPSGYQSVSQGHVFVHPARGVIVPKSLVARMHVPCGGEPVVLPNGFLNPDCFEHRDVHHKEALPSMNLDEAAADSHPPAASGDSQQPDQPTASTTTNEPVPTGVVVAASFGGLAALASAGAVGYYTWLRNSGESGDSEAMLYNSGTQLKSLSTGVSEAESEAESEKFEVDGDITFWSKQADFAAF